MTKIPQQFYLNHDVIAVSKNLLGKFLVTNINNQLTAGMIIETEAYRGPEDKASHAYNNRRTKRTETMFATGGRSYVYLCYGIHHLFNIVTNQAQIPHAVLIRAIKPVDGIDIMLQRRRKQKLTANLTQGPGTTSQALAITTALDNYDLTGNVIWLEDRGITINPQQIITGPRVGVDYAGEDALLPWRFQVSA